MKRKVFNLLLSVMLCVLCIPAMKINAAGTAINIELNSDGSCQADSGTGFQCETTGNTLSNPLITVYPGYNATIVTNGYIQQIVFYADEAHTDQEIVSGYNPILVNGEYSDDISSRFVVTLEKGNITGGEYGLVVWNYGTISGGIFDGDVHNMNSITNGLFKKTVYDLDKNKASGGIFLAMQPSNAKSLTITNARIDGAGSADKAYVVPGTSVNITAQQTLSHVPFSKWDVTKGNLQLANSLSVTFTMPDEDIAIEAIYKETPTPTASAASSTVASSGWVPSYEIQFKDCNGKVISDQWVGDGQPAAIPDGYTYGEEELNWVYRNLTVSPISCKAAGYVVPDTADKN